MSEFIIDRYIIANARANIGETEIEGFQCYHAYCTKTLYFTNFSTVLIRKFYTKS